MGVFLDKPKKEKESECGEGNGLRYALCSMQGWRVEMEDSHSIRIDLGPVLKKCSYFAVFDGHAGDFVSKYISENLIDTILELWMMKTPNNDNNDNTVNKVNSEKTAEVGETDAPCLLTDSSELERFKQNIKDGFLKIDSSMREHPKFLSPEEKSGTTAVTAFVTPDKVIFANCGDSRGVLANNNSVRFGTYDHKPCNEEEKKRIENAGGSVMIRRVNGSLAVSRALGDFDYKNVSGLPPTQQLVSAEPDLSVMDRSDQDEFLVLACDGVWDVMTNEEVVSYIYSRLLINDDLQKVCEELLETCLAKGSRDNMSVILITFPAAPKLSNEAIEQERKLDAVLKEKVQAIVKEDESATLNSILEELQTQQIDNLPPGGGIHAKLCMIEEMLDELLPNRSKEENRGQAMPVVPLSMIRQLASDGVPVGLDPSEEAESTPPP